MKKTAIFFSIFFVILLVLSLFLVVLISEVPKNVHVSNLTDRSVTISWTTRRATPGSVVLVEDGVQVPIKFSLDEDVQVYPDDRDLAVKTLAQVSSPDFDPTSQATVIVEDDERSDFYTHHISITGLEPNKKYTYMIGNDLAYVAVSSVELQSASFTTLNENNNQAIEVPDPAYGLVMISEKDREPVDEGIVYMRIVDSETNENSTLISTLISSDGSWYTDLTQAKDPATNQMFLKEKDRESDKIYHQSEIVLNYDESFSVEIPISEDAPARDIFKVNEMLHSTIDQKVNDLLAQLSSVVETNQNPQNSSIILSTSAICCESIVCNDGTTFERDVHTPHTTCDARAAEGCRNHGGVKSQAGACDTSDVPIASNFCLQYCGIDSNQDGKLASYEANFDLRGQWCECCEQDCGGGFGCESDSRFTRECKESNKTPSPDPGSTPKPPSSQPNPPSTPNPPSEPSNPSVPPKANTPKVDPNGHLPLMVRWFNYLPQMGPAYVYAMTHAGQKVGIGALNADVTKMLMSFNYAELQQHVTNTSLLNGWGVTEVGYNTEGSHTPANEMASMSNCDANSNYVAKAAKISTENGYRFTWGPIRAMVDSVPDCAIETMIRSGMRGVALQEQKYIESEPASVRLSAVKKSIERYDRIAAKVGVTDMDYHVQIMEERCPNMNSCVAFVKGLEEIPVTSIAIWSNGGISMSFVNTIRGGGTGGSASTSNVQEPSPYGMGGGGSDIDPNAKVSCIHEKMIYEHGTSYSPDGVPALYCFDGKMNELSTIAQGEICPSSTFCYCEGSKSIIGVDDSEKLCEGNELVKNPPLDSEQKCTSSNACRGRSPDSSSCVDIEGEKLQLYCSVSCQESWDPCKDISEVKASKSKQISSSSNHIKNEDLFSQLIKGARAQENNTADLLISPTNGLLHFPSAGNYCLYYEQDYYCFNITAKRDNLVYIDKNGDSKYSIGVDVNLGEDATVLKVMINEVETIYSFKEGQNFISFSQIPNINGLTATQLLSDMNSNSGTKVLSIAKYHSGRWVVVGQRDGQTYKSEDFLILPGVGYLVRAQEDFEYTMIGKAILEPVPVRMMSGWNLIGINGLNQSGYTAETIIDSVDENSEMDAVNVTKWNRNVRTFEGLQKSEDSSGEMQIYGFDYPVLNYQGYFVKINSGSGEWVPEESL